MRKLLVVAVIVFALAVMAAGHNVYAGPHDGAALLSGKVADTMDSGGYTYVLLEKDGKKTWVAVPQMKVAKGQSMSFQPGVEMSNFTSKTLKRTFDKIYFSGGPLK